MGACCRMTAAGTPAKSASSALFTPLAIANGKIQLKHRIVLSPCTRNRGVPLTEGTVEVPNRTWVPDALVAEYYGQRASEGGLLITEGITPSPEGGAMPGVPGMWLAEQAEGWKLVTNAVHAKGGYIYAQLCHQGRTSIPQYSGVPTVSSSATPWSTDEKYPYPPPGKSYSERVPYKDYPPIALTIPHLKQTIAGHVAAAKMAIECGFDGVEIHGGNGYLVDQFLNSNVNKRTDEYGGTPEKRGQFAVELVKAVGEAIGECNVSFKVSPWGVYNDMGDESRFQTWSILLKNLKRALPALSYVAFVEPRTEELSAFEESWGLGRELGLAWARDLLGEIPVMSAGGWDGENIWGVAESGRVDMCAFGRWFIANPDMPDRLRKGRSLNMYNRAKFYGPTSKRELGYTDYPTWEEAENRESQASESAAGK